MSLTGCATGRAEDTTTARSYRTSFAERERLHLRQEFHFGRRAFKLNSTVATQGPLEWIKYQAGKAVSKARMKQDPAYFTARTGRRPWANPWYWETLKSRRGYDPQNPLTVLAHVFECWDQWLTVTHRPNKGNRLYAEALVLARRVLRRWRHLTVWEQLLAPTWQRVRLNARLLPPLPTPSVSTPPRISPNTSRLLADYYSPGGGRDRKIPLATWRYGSPWRLTLQEHEERAQETSEYDRWRSAQNSLLQDFDRLHPGRVWLRSWHTVDCPISRSHCPTVLWYDFRPSVHAGHMQKRERYSRPPPKFRLVICHYGQPFSWHWIEAAPTFGPVHCFQPHGPATGWQESVLFTTVGSSSGSFTSQVHSFRARSVHLGLFNTKASDTTAVTESAECYSSAAADVEDLSGAGELTSFAQRSEQASALDARSPPSVSPRSAEKRPGTCNNEDAEAEDFYAVDGVASRLALRNWKVLENAWCRWLKLYRDRQHTLTVEDRDGWVRPLYISDSEDDLPRTLVQCFRETQDRRTLEHVWAHWIEFVAERHCYSDGHSDDSEWSSIIYDDAHDYFFPDNHLDFDSYFDCLFYDDSVPPPCTRNAWRADCAINVAAADLDGTWELPSLAESDCAGERELIRYTICASTMAFEDSAAAAIAWERSLSPGSQLDRSHSASN